MTATRQAVVIFGEALIDEFPHQRVVGGAPFNVARTLAYFQCAPLMISRIGNDENAALIRNEIQRYALISEGIQTDMTHPTGRVVVTQDDSGDKTHHRFDILRDQAYDHIDAEAAFHVREYVYPDHHRGVLYFGTLAQRQPSSSAALQRLLTTTDALKYLDLNLRTGQYTPAVIEESLYRADILKINEEELEMLARLYLAGQISAPADDATAKKFVPLLKLLITMFDLQAIIVTRGARGYVYLDRDEQLLSNGEHQIDVDVVDTVGGGDAFSAIFLLGIYRGWETALSLQRAHQFAAAICGIRGAVPQHLDFYRSWQQQWKSA
ncbi:PfkB family carbohydrate kinase [Undibacterium griseum]|uniref:Fructokinase n=1 Tax=Undibacterium griseum TaxID=2762295 RepID=A0ABR6YK08_9BURK|nr:PfkB family carbohydrate kinase [Undibacterium griseum]MBC3884241.1 fructokinase [Undibacterium griseum]